jgi:hypothetical protein
MGNKSRKRRTTKKSRKDVPATRQKRIDTGTSTAEEVASQRMLSDLLVRGEAVKLTKNGKLPLSATHVIDDRASPPSRARFKLA